MRADKFFAEKFGSRTKSAEAIEKGLVLLNGKPIRPKDEITGDEEFSFPIPVLLHSLGAGGLFFQKKRRICGLMAPDL